jgi:hypothetical protein
MDFIQGETRSIDLKDHYQFIMGDTVPEMNGDTLTFEVINENPDIVTASINGNMLMLVAGDTIGDSKIKVIVSAGFTERMDYLTVTRGTDDISEFSNEQSVMIYPNPLTTSATIEYELNQPEKVTLTIYDYLGKQVYQAQEDQPQGKQQLIWNTEELQAGIYFCVLKTNQGTQTTKLIKLNN